MSEFRIEGLDEQLRNMVNEAMNRDRYDKLRYEVGRNYLDNCAKHCGEVSGQLIASYKRQEYGGKKEWVLNGKFTDAIEAGTKVFYARMVNDGHR
ncbi:MAG: hypothetical protein K6U07_03135, partial [Firmicutes bacterium]|nr:hypothetical protein [Bacillota bacterium]